MKITAKMFKHATGYEPVDDDLERVNCSKAGQLAHVSCGWDHERNMPVFMPGQGKPFSLSMGLDREAQDTVEGRT